MGSPAARTYEVISTRARIILGLKQGALSRTDLQALYGAWFVTQVAAWNAYVVGVVACFFDDVANPGMGHFHAMHTLASGAAKIQLERFNTPNAENTRNVILMCTGYDPWTDWQWPRRGLSALDVRVRLNEILKVRHSLAHGFAMPNYSWTQSAWGQSRLTLSTVRWTRSFLDNLVATTERAIRRHVSLVYGITPAW